MSTSSVALAARRSVASLADVDEVDLEFASRSGDWRRARLLRQLTAPAPGLLRFLLMAAYGSALMVLDKLRKALASGPRSNSWG